jgi:hypothetical protein
MRISILSLGLFAMVSCQPRDFNKSSSDINVVAGQLVTANDAVMARIVGFNVTEHDSGSGRPDRFSANYSCGAVRIGPNQLVTAAHCFWKAAFVNTSENSGHVNMQDAEHLATVRFFWGPRRFPENFAYENPSDVTDLPPLDRETGWKVTGIEIHPRFAQERKSGGGSFDIALVTFEGEPPQGTVVTPIASPAMNLKANPFWVAGYGFPYEPKRGMHNGTASTERMRALNAQYGKPGLLRKGASAVAKVDEAARTFTLKNRGGLFGARDAAAAACHGDSGGPGFVALEDGSLAVAGVVSHGSDPRASCEDTGGVYTDIRRYQGWMKCTFAAMGKPLLGLADDASSSDCSR